MSYQYDSLGNMVKEVTGNNKGSEYWYNGLNQQIKTQIDNKDTFSYTFDRRGNLVEGLYDKKGTVAGEFVYDATNRMVKGVNEKGEESHCFFNGLGYLVSKGKYIRLKHIPEGNKMTYKIVSFGKQ